ncbi:hypothetical protein CEXT_715621 [Caerostris extrusa]|uniref:Uncharacterized protein n=1 Tax=Caerostris extrusa TaxID=172846 RepID=A0AAV4MN27_CAEEX|nr:hypothetical protein CEXT_715621 [Caerostris extrusa]
MNLSYCAGEGATEARAAQSERRPRRDQGDPSPYPPPFSRWRTSTTLGTSSSSWPTSPTKNSDPLRTPTPCGTNSLHKCVILVQESSIFNLQQKYKVSYKFMRKIAKIM